MRKDLFTIGMIFVLGGGSAIGASLDFSMVKSKVEYKEQVEKVKELNAQLKEQGFSYSTGLLPSPVKGFVHGKDDFKSGDLHHIKEVNYPDRFDLSDPDNNGNRDDSLLTPITDQGQCGVCWAFAGYGAYEGQLKIDGLGTFDLSEQNLRYTNGTDLSNDDPCSGGFLGMVTSYLVRGSGPVKESDDPYDLDSGNSYNPNAKAFRFVDNVIELPVRDINHKMDINYLKDALYTLKKPLYVPVQVGFGTAGETGKSSWDSATNSFYCDGGGTICQANHAVVIVGWDDNYDAQGQTGAFIVRNSWGSSFGENGYFYVPYNDDSIALENTIAYFKDNAESALQADHIYQHDTLPLISRYGDGDNTTDEKYANVYTMEKKSKVKAIVFYANGFNTNYTFQFYSKVEKDPNNDDYSVFKNSIGSVQSGSVSNPGWYTVLLDSPFIVSQNSQLVVEMSSTNNSGSSIELEIYYEGFSSDATAELGEGYFYDGRGWYDWMEAYPSYKPSNALKVLVDEDDTTEYKKVNIASVIMYMLN